MFAALNDDIDLNKIDIGCKNIIPMVSDHLCIIFDDFGYDMPIKIS